MRAQTAPKRAPEYNLVRVVTAADGAADYLKKSNGVNFGSYLKAGFQVVPINTATPGEVDGSADLLTGATSAPTVVLYFWNEVLGKFMIHNPTIAPAALIAGVGFEFDADVAGRIVMPSVTGGVTGGQGVLIFATALGHNEALG